MAVEFESEPDTKRFAYEQGGAQGITRLFITLGMAKTVAGAERAMIGTAVIAIAAAISVAWFTFSGSKPKIDIRYTTPILTPAP